jgi:uncharacterized membrane protein
VTQKQIESYINAEDLFVFIIHLFQVVSLYNANNMNKFIVIAILPLFVIILTFKWSNAAAVNTGGSATSSQVDGIKRYVFLKCLLTIEILLCFKVLQCNMSSVLLAVVV